MELRNFARTMGVVCAAIGGLQTLGGTRAEPGMTDDATVDSHVRFMGTVFVGYGIGWLDAASRDDTQRMRVLGGLMALGGAGRLVTRGTLGRPHRFHDVLLAVELATPVAIEVLARRPRSRTAPRVP